MTRVNPKDLNGLTWVNEEEPASKHLPLSHFLDYSTFELQNGQIGSAIRFEGIPFETISTEELEQFRRLKHAVISELDESFSLYEYIARFQLDLSLKGSFPDAFTAEVDTAYQAQFSEKNFYRNDLVLVVLYRGPGSEKIHQKIPFFEALSWKGTRAENIKHMRQKYREDACQSLQRVMEQWCSTLAPFKPTLLGKETDRFGYSSLLSFWGQLANGLHESYFFFPEIFPPRIRGQIQSYSGALPVGKAAEYITTHRLFFGERIQFLGPDGSSKFAQILSIRGYPQSTRSSMLDGLLHLDAEFLCTNSFLIEKTSSALSKIDRHRVKMKNTQDRATSQLDSLAECQDQLASGSLRMGYHHHTLMVLSKTPEGLKAAVNEAIRAYTEASFSVIPETLGLEAAFWAQFPGNQSYIFRSSFITSQNYTDFCPLHNYRTGYVDQNHLGSAVTLLETSAKTPLFFNFHSKGSGSRHDLTPGHTTIIGGNGCGKTVFMGFMDSQLSRYRGRSYFFDRDRGLEIYIRATGGAYVLIRPSASGSCGFNPFSLEDSPSNRAFLKMWLKALVRVDVAEVLDPVIERMLADCVDYGFESLLKEHRSLSRVIRLLPMNFPRWDRLRQWLRAEGKYSSGEYATLFDNQEDYFSSHSLQNNTKMGFDLTELMNQPKEVLTSVCMYLMHQIKNHLDGSRVSIFFDEGWQILDNPYWVHQLKQDLPTFRKMNAHLILATQSPESILSSSLSAQFLDNAATHIFFCNPKANFESHYRHFHITPSEFHFISTVSPGMRWFLYKQGQESSICRLNLSAMDRYLAVYSGNSQTVQSLDAIRAEVGDDPSVWLPIFYQKVLGRKGS
jgi:type IV secretion system protein VirB4